eukprot:PhM_4_TR7837/c0_g1_i1/m.13949/K10392/KIF1; kinesin family member 1
MMMLTSPRRGSHSPGLLTPTHSFNGSSPSAVSAAAAAAAAASDNVKVICRVRPFNEREKGLVVKENEAVSHDWDRKQLRAIVDMYGKVTVVLDHHNEFAEKHRFSFDESFWSIPDEQQKSGNEFATQELVFRRIGGPALQHSWNGFNTCLFAYGQTGAGKTYTMMGTDSDPGLIPQLCQELFNSIQRRTMEDAENMEEGKVNEYTVEARFLEIYNEHVKDLLWDLDSDDISVHSGSGLVGGSGGVDRENLKVRNFPGQGPVVVGLTAVKVQSWEQMVNLIDVGTSNRTQAATKMNDRSSRSHAVFRITFTQTTKLLPKKSYEKMQVLDRFSNLNLVDLAGSERLKKSGAEGIHLKEAAAINKSLTTLKQVIDALVDGKQVVPYRESQLTWLLSESLGGNSRTFMIACISPHEDNAEETLNTLRYALRAQGIVCHAQVNDSDDLKRVTRLQDEKQKLQEMMDTGYSVELQGELAATQEALAAVQSRLGNVRLEAAEVERAMQQQREMRYAKWFLDVFKVRRMRNEHDEVLQRSNSIKRKLMADGTTTDHHRTTVSDAEKLRAVLAEAEAEAAGVVAQQQNDRTFWQQKIEHLEVLQKELLLTEENLRAEAAKKEIQKRLAVLAGDASNRDLRTVIETQAQKVQEEQADEIQTVSARAVLKYDEAAEKGLQKQTALETEITQLRRDIVNATDDLEEIKADCGRRIDKLETERIFLVQEKTRGQMDFHQMLKEMSDSWTRRFDERKAELKAENTRAHSNWVTRHESRMFELHTEAERAGVEWDSELEEARRRGEQRLAEVQRHWAITFEEQSDELREEVNAQMTINVELRQALTQYESTDSTVQCLYDSILNTVRTVLEGKCVSPPSYELLSLVDQLQNPAADGYSSVTPLVYAIAPRSNACHDDDDQHGMQYEPMHVPHRAIHFASDPAIFFYPRSASPAKSGPASARSVSKARGASPGNSRTPSPLTTHRSVSPMQQQSILSRSRSPSAHVMGNPALGLATRHHHDPAAGSAAITVSTSRRPVSPHTPKPKKIVPRRAVSPIGSSTTPKVSPGISYAARRSPSPQVLAPPSYTNSLLRR